MPTVHDIMSVITGSLSPTDTLADVVAVMREQEISCVLVCDEGKPTGIVTERDVVRIYAEHILDPSIATYAVAKIMTTNPICVHDTLPVSDALVLARSRGVRHLPVLDEHGSLVGIVTQTDAINAYLESLETNNQLRQDNEDLKLLSLQDPLIKIGNRRALGVEISHLDAESRRYDKPYAIAMIDVDFFKRYNDHYGHPAGDEALIDVAGIIKQVVREADRLFRYGGEELLVLMPNTDQEQAAILAERIREAVEALAIAHSKSPFGHITVCVGVAQRQKTPVVTIKYADKALYQAKESGRNRVGLAP